MRHRGLAPQTGWLMPPIYRTGATGATSQANGGGQTYGGSGPINLAVTLTTQVIDLTTICGSGAKAEQPQGTDDWNPNPVDHLLYLQADGDNVYIAFGDSPTIFGALVPTTTTGVTGASFGAAAGTSFTGAQGTTTTGVKVIKDAWMPPIKIPVGRPPPGTPYDNADWGKYSPARYMAFVAGSTGSGVYLRVWQGSD